MTSVPDRDIRRARPRKCRRAASLCLTLVLPGEAEPNDEDRLEWRQALLAPSWTGAARVRGRAIMMGGAVLGSDKENGDLPPTR